MNYEKFIDKKEVQIGNKTFCISKIPAIEATIIYPKIAKYYSENGVIGLTMFDLDLTKKILAYTAVHNGDDWDVLDLDTRINRALSNQFDMKKLVMLMVQENWGFLTDGSLLDVLGIQGVEAESGS